MNKYVIKVFIIFIAVSILGFSTGNPIKDYTGFSDTNAPIQKKWEAGYDSLLQAPDINNMVKISSVCHHVIEIRDSVDKMNALIGIVLLN